MIEQACGVDCRNGEINQDVSGTLQAKPGGASLNTNIVVLIPCHMRDLCVDQAGRCAGPSSPPTTKTLPWSSTKEGMQMDSTQYIVRRLTPTECERLQGYPDGWTDLKPIEDMSDEDVLFWQNALFEIEVRDGRARQDENGVWRVWKCTEATPSDPAMDDVDNAEPELVWENTGKEYKHKTKAQLIAWYNRSFCDCDSKRYKAMGNSIALPQWRYTLERMAAYLPAGATLGSLFDGVGGFPLIWESTHGTGTALWASEIELFPIAVTRCRFGAGEQPGAGK